MRLPACPIIWQCTSNERYSIVLRNSPNVSYRLRPFHSIYAYYLLWNESCCTRRTRQVSGKVFVKHAVCAQQKGPRKAEAFGKAMSR